MHGTPQGRDKPPIKSTGSAARTTDKAAAWVLGARARRGNQAGSLREVGNSLATNARSSEELKSKWASHGVRFLAGYGDAFAAEPRI